MSAPPSFTAVGEGEQRWRQGGTNLALGSLWDRKAGTQFITGFQARRAPYAKYR